MAVAPEAAAATRPRRLPGLTTQIFIGLVIGILIGWLKPSWGVEIKPLADIFLRMIKMIIAPLVFATLVVGIAGSGDLKTMGRVGLKAFVYFTASTLIALAISLAMVNAFQPGAGVALPPTDTAELAVMASRQQTGWDIVVHMVPTSVVAAMANGDVLQVVVFAVFFGIAVAAVGEPARPLLGVLDAVALVMFKVTGIVMWFAPFGVMAAIAATVGGKGLGILLTLGKLVLVMYGSLLLFVLIVVVGVSYLVRVPFPSFFRAIREPFLIAFTTASSEAALPRALEVMERFGVPRRIAGFVLPTGYSFNLDGSTLYLAVASIFVAQMAGIDLSWGQQLLMMATLLVTSKGVAGVPRASLVILTAMLTTFGLPLEGAAILLGVDQILDMARTSVNVMGNCIATVVVARWEGEFDDAKMRAF